MAAKATARRRVIVRDGRESPMRREKKYELCETSKTRPLSLS